jgi:ppGpp synthetase/RelA/SpoT-type nucleotidyltranferase
MSGSDSNNAGGEVALENTYDPFKGIGVFDASEITKPKSRPYPHFMHGRFRSAARAMFWPDIDKAVSQFLAECYQYNPKCNIELIRAAAEVAILENYKLQKDLNRSVRDAKVGEKKRQAKKLLLNDYTHMFKTATLTARLSLDSNTNTGAEAIVGALMQNIVALGDGDKLSERIQQQVIEIYRRNIAQQPIGWDQQRQNIEPSLTMAMILARDAARITRMPYLVSFDSMSEDQHNAYFRDMLSAVLHTPHVRTHPIKITEMVQRLRNLESIQDPEAREQLLLYAEKLYLPWARFIGWYDAVGEIQDLLFKAREPAQYQLVVKKVKAEHGDDIYDRGREIMAERSARLQAIIKKETGLDVSVQGRVKRPGSIMQKIRDKNDNRKDKKTDSEYTFDDIEDIVAFRVVVPNEDSGECRAVESALRKAYIEAKVKTDDYLAGKKNGYRSLHAVVDTGKKGGKFEVQIRTRQMQAEAEYGLNITHLQYNGVEATAEEIELAKGIRAKLWQHASDRAAPTINLNLSTTHAFDGQGRIRKFPKGMRVIDFLATAYPDGNLPKRVWYNGEKIDLTKEFAQRELINGDHISPMSKEHPPIDKSWLEIPASEQGRAYIQRILDKQAADPVRTSRRRLRYRRWDR